MRSIFAAVCSLAVFASLSTAAENATRPNILLILSDDHSVPHVGCYGNKDIKTPHLDHFAAEGIRCDRAYVDDPRARLPSPAGG
jgi:hypothetical protein